MIAQAEHIKEKILDVKNGRVKEGLKIGIEGIDEFLRYKQGNWSRKCGKNYYTMLSFYIMGN